MDPVTRARLEALEKWKAEHDIQCNTRLRWIIGLMATAITALSMALVTK